MKLVRRTRMVGSRQISDAQLRIGESRDPGCVADATLRDDASSHIGGAMPSRPTPMRLVSSDPSSFFTAPKMMIFAPGLISDLSPLTKATIEASGGTTTFFSPSLYLT